jgi:branched-chain amino acid transport system permease protein
MRNGEDINGFQRHERRQGHHSRWTGSASGRPSSSPAVPDTLGPFDLTYKFLVYVLLAAFCVFVSLRIREGRLGRAWLAIREDELAASMMGVPLMQTKLAAYAVGRLRRRLGGVAYATHTGASVIRHVPVLGLDHPARDGRPRRHGQRLGRHDRRARPVLDQLHRHGAGRHTVNDALGTNIDFPSYNFLIFGVVLVLMMLFRREGLIPRPGPGRCCRNPSAGEIESLGAEMEGTGEERRSR